MVLMFIYLLILYVCHVQEFSGVMGLDLECGGESMKMGSYTSVHRQRIGLMLATIARAKATGDHRGAKLLRSAISRDNREINYTVIKRISPYFEMDTKGLFCFIDRSDCQGCWSDSDAESIMIWLRNLHPWTPQIEELESFIDPVTGEYHLEFIFKRSVETGEPVFCV